jgi:hypothetical protein
VPDSLRAGFLGAPVATWISVLPQLCAQVDCTEAAQQDVLRGLLCRLAEIVPQAVVFSAVAGVASTTVGSVSFVTFTSVVDEIARCNAPLLRAAQTLATEMKRITVLWEEQWIELLERRQV